jgi:hypothetical protein
MVSGESAVVVEALIVTEHAPAVVPPVPSPVVQVAPFGKVTSPSVVNDTATPATVVPPSSFTVTVAVEVAFPSATIEGGASATVMVGGTENSVSVAVPDLVADVAVMVSVSAVVEAVIVTEHFPAPSVTHAWFDEKVTSPLVVKFTAAFTTGAPPVAVTVARAVEVAGVFGGTVWGEGVAGMTAGVSERATAAGGTNSTSGFESDVPPELAVMVSVSAVVDA